MTMRGGCRAPLIVLLVAGVAAWPLACSGGDDDAQREGSIVIGMYTQPDSLDPALGFTLTSAAPLNHVYLPLLTYRRAEDESGTQLIPGLAEALPKVSPDHKTYTLRLRTGLVYSDGSRVRAGDFEHAIKRVLNMGSSGAPFYENIAGARAFEEGRDPNGDIAGIQTDDRARKIVIKLERPYAAFNHLLALTLATPVPRDTPFENTTKQPPPSTGPFEITRSDPGQEFVLERNPKFESLGIDGVPPARLDRITVRIIVDKDAEAEDVLDGKLDYMYDSPPADLLPTIHERADDRYEENELTGSTNWFFMNGRLPPFNDARVRQAVNYAVDKPALARIYAGGLVEGCSFIPSGIAGYDRSLDTTGCPFGDPRKPPDVERAKRLIQEAGAEGAKVTVWGFNQSPQGDVTEAYAQTLRTIGLDARPKLVAFTAWRPAIGNAKNKAQTGFDAFTQVFPHPLTFFELVQSDAIRPEANKNTSYISDPVIDRTVRRLQGETDIESVRDEWARLNRYLVEQAYLVPYGHRIRGTFVSDRIDFKHCTVFHPIYLEDWSRFCLKEGER
jgi:peptide/nickel transport system substrate-binding protein